MVTEYIKREQRMGYGENGVLVYKIPVSEPSPLAEYNTTEEEEVVEDTIPALNLI